MAYSHSEIDKKWQKAWEKGKIFQAETVSSKPKYYALNMFPYPSGQGLHVGHMASYTPTDVIARYKKAKGFNVMNPMGYDAFGLPAEQYAIQTGIHPALTTQKSIENFRRQLRLAGFGFDWSREISTCEPNYYKWTQFIFGKLFEKGLAYQKEVPVNWCPALRTVLANEEVIDGKSERGGHPVVRKPMKQWMLKITNYAERLLEGLDRIDWPERTKEGQRNWIGKSQGAEIQFKVDGHAETLTVFTTRPDTLFGVSFLVVAPEHPWVQLITTASQKADVQAYIQKAASKLEVDRKAGLDKFGVFTGSFALHPFTGEKIPIWTADYVLMDYGTGAIMAVPGHDSRDFEFAKTHHLPIKRVLQSETELPFEGDGALVDSEFLNGLSSSAAIQRMCVELEKKAVGHPVTRYKLRDWLFSRQRYWGEPFPIVHFMDGTSRVLPLNELPVTLPEVADYEPTEQGEPPLARVKEWVHYQGALGSGQRETDTMPGSAGSSWYFLRFIDPHNDSVFCDFNAQKYWMPVDLYVGGPEHTVGHLLYARFWQKVLFDAGLVTHDEPFQKLTHQGMILGPDGEKMSKSRGNTIPADDVCEQFGADAMRTFILFLGPLERDKPWNIHGIEGSRRFLERVWRLVEDEGLTDEAPSDEILKLLHKTIKRVTHDIESMSFNTAISAMMIYVNELYRTNTRSKAALKPLIQLLAPIAPHICEEMWTKLGGQGFVVQAPWPSYEEALCQDSEVEMGVQVNGKMRGTIRISLEADEAAALDLARAVPSVQNAMGGLSLKKVIYKPGKILNLIVG